MKKAISHIEIMVSFVLFFGFLAFLFFIINPFAKTEVKNDALDFFQKQIIKNWTIEIKKISVILNESNGCYNLSEDLLIRHLEIKEDEKKYNLFFSDLLNEYHPNLKDNCDAKNFSIGSISKENFLFEDYIIFSKLLYESDYENLKSNLNLNKDFAFVFKDLNGNVILGLSSEKEVISKIERDAKEIPVRVIDKNGVIKEYVLNLRVW